MRLLRRPFGWRVDFEHPLVRVHDQALALAGDTEDCREAVDAVAFFLEEELESAVVAEGALGAGIDDFVKRRNHRNRLIRQIAELLLQAFQLRPGLIIETRSEVGIGDSEAIFLVRQIGRVECFLRDRVFEQCHRHDRIHDCADNNFQVHTVFACRFGATSFRGLKRRDAVCETEQGKLFAGAKGLVKRRLFHELADDGIGRAFVHRRIRTDPVPADGTQTATNENRGMRSVFQCQEDLRRVARLEDDDRRRKVRHGLG